MSALLYWALELSFPFALDGTLHEHFITYGHTAQDVFLAVCAISALRTAPNKYKCCAFVMLIHSVFAGVVFSFGDMDAPFIQAISMLFFVLWAWVARRPPLPKQLPFDKDNILLAFYTGDNGSFIMNLFQTMDEPVSSMCILSGKYSLKLKRGRDSFKFTENHGFFREWDNYHIIDTGVKSNEDFIENMRQCGNMKAKRFGLRINCIISIKDLLGMIGEEWRPIGLLENSPSGYFRKASRL